MVNEIKFDSMGVPVTQGKIEKNTQQSAVQVNKEAGITVTNHLSKLVSLLGGDETIPGDQARVMEMKHKIQANEYSPDLGVLSEKLLNSGVLTVGG